MRELQAFTSGAGKRTRCSISKHRLGSNRAQRRQDEYCMIDEPRRSDEQIIYFEALGMRQYNKAERTRVDLTNCYCAPAARPWSMWGPTVTEDNTYHAIRILVNPSIPRSDRE